MSKIDGFLRLAATQSADEVVLREEQPPSLRIKGSLRKLAMDPLDAALIREIVREAIGERADAPDGDERCVVSSGPVRIRWKTGDRLEVVLSRARLDAPLDLGRPAATTPPPFPIAVSTSSRPV
jgi:hypothetical protein